MKVNTDDIVIGTHIDSNINTINNTLESLPDNINAVQFFVDPSNDQNKYKSIKRTIIEKNIYAFIHSSYKINIAKEWDDSSWWVKYMIYEIKTAHLLGVEGLVIHTGHKMNLHTSVAINNMYTFLMHIHNATKNENNVKLLIETPAGQGSEMLSNYEKFINFMTKFNTIDRFGVCIDTCHMFAAGYDIRKPKILKKIISQVKHNLCLIHLNDSKDDLGSLKDRHESLGYGFIGRVGLRKIIKALKSINIPIILETPSIQMIAKLSGFSIYHFVITLY